MFFDISLIQRLASYWSSEVPRKHRPKMGKDPHCKERTSLLYPFLERNGIEITNSNIVRTINLCDIAARECREHARQITKYPLCISVLLLAILMSMIGLATWMPELRNDVIKLPISVTIMAIISCIVFMVAVEAHTIRKNELVHAFERDIRIASMNQLTLREKRQQAPCIQRKNQIEKSNIFLNNDRITDIAKAWNAQKGSLERIRNNFFPGETGSQPYRTLTALPDFLESIGVCANAQSLISLCEVAMERPELIRSRFESFIIGILGSFIFWIMTSTPDTPYVTSILLVSFVVIIIFIFVILPYPHRRQIWIIRLKEDLVAAKESGILD